MRIVSIVGARPQFIKLAPLDRELREHHEHVIIHTGQHYDYEMSKAFFDQLDISEPDHNLEIGSGSHAWQTGQMLYKLGETLQNLKPHLVIVYGDTNSTLAGALAAVKLHIPSAHVEAGYRSHDISMPEEVNRVVTDRIVQLHFAPTRRAVQNLLNEGVETEQIFMVGNVMAESLLRHMDRIEKSKVLDEMNLEPGSYAMLTCHRPENTNDPARLRNIMTTLAETPFEVIFPAHPRTAAYLEESGLLGKLDGSSVRLLPPMKYIEFLKLQSQAACVITDSGGIQEEALVLGVPCITLRYNTERVETLDCGGNCLVGADPKLIREAIQALGSGAWTGSVPENWDTEVAARIVRAIDENRQLLRIEAQVF